MGKQIPLFDQSFECHKDIARLIASRVKPEIKVRCVCSLKIHRPTGEKRAFIDVLPLSSLIPGLNKQELRQEVGIPQTALIPEKVAPIAYWLVREFKRKRPDLFQESDVTQY